jgi:hypothetical protein
MVAQLYLQAPGSLFIAYNCQGYSEYILSPCRVSYVNTSDKSEVLRKLFGLKENGISNLGYYITMNL